MASIKVRRATIKDIAQYEALQAARWSDGNQASHEQLMSRFSTYPEGMLVAEMDGRVVGMVFVMRIASYDYGNPPSWYEITNNGMCNNHVPDGKIIFGVDLSTEPGVGGKAGDALLVEVGRIAIRENIEWCMLGGRMPGYHAYKDAMSADEYLFAKNGRGQFLDRQVNYYSNVAGLRVIKPLKDYFDDPDSCNYGVLLRWHNPLYNWPFSRFWSSIFPFLFRLEEQYIKLNKRFKHKRRKRPSVVG